MLRLVAFVCFILVMCRDGLEEIGMMPFFSRWLIQEECFFGELDKRIDCYDGLFHMVVVIFPLTALVS